LYTIQVELLQQLPRITAVAGRDVASRHAKHRAAVEVRGGREQPACWTPTNDGSARYISGADGQPTTLPRGIEERPKVLGPVRAVGVHLHKQFVTLLQAPLEAGEIGAAEAEPTLAMEDVNARIRGCEFISEMTGAVWGVVVDNQDVEPEAAHAADGSAQVL